MKNNTAQLDLFAAFADAPAAPVALPKLQHTAAPAPAVVPEVLKIREDDARKRAALTPEKRAELDATAESFGRQLAEISGTDYAPSAAEPLHAPGDGFSNHAGEPVFAHYADLCEALGLDPAELWRAAYEKHAGGEWWPFSVDDTDRAAQARRATLEDFDAVLDDLEDINLHKLYAQLEAHRPTCARCGKAWTDTTRSLGYCDGCGENAPRVPSRWTREPLEDGAILVVGQRLHCILYGGKDGSVYDIDGDQSPGTVRSLGGGIMTTGGRANFSIVWDSGSTTNVPESIVRGVQWTIYKDVATPAEIEAAITHAGEVTAQKKREAAEAARARTDRARKLRETFAGFLEGTGAGKYASASLGAANLRKQLRIAFPGVKFSVKSKTYSGGDSIDIAWELGPTAAEVEAISGKYQEGGFNAMEDIYESNRENVWPEVFGGAKYVNTSRAIPEPTVLQLAADFCKLENKPFSADDLYSYLPGRDNSLASIVRRIVSRQSFAPGAVILGLARTACKAGQMEEFYRVVVEGEEPEPTTPEPQPAAVVEEATPEPQPEPVNLRGWFAHPFDLCKAHGLDFGALAKDNPLPAPAAAPQPTATELAGQTYTMHGEATEGHTARVLGPCSLLPSSRAMIEDTATGKQWSAPVERVARILEKEAAPEIGPEWISVKHRGPIVGVRVRFLYTDGHESEGHRTSEAPTWYEHKADDTVSHWQPLGEPQPTSWLGDKEPAAVEEEAEEAAPAMVATYNITTDKIHFQPGADRLPPAQYEAAKAARFVYWPGSRQFVAKWNTAAEDFLQSLGVEIEEDDTPDDTEARVNRFDKYAERSEAAAENAAEYLAERANTARRRKNASNAITRGLSEAEHWQHRIAASIRHAAHKERADVIARRIKGLEADERKYLSEVAPVDASDPRSRSVYNGEVSLWVGGRHGAWIKEAGLAGFQARAQRWLDHTQKRLQYERALLEACGGTAAQQTAPEVGGAIRGTWQAREWTLISKINKTTVEILGSGSRYDHETRCTAPAIVRYKVPMTDIKQIRTRAEVEAATAAGERFAWAEALKLPKPGKVAAAPACPFCQKAKCSTPDECSAKQQEFFAELDARPLPAVDALAEAAARNQAARAEQIARLQPKKREAAAKAEELREDLKAAQEGRQIAERVQELAHVPGFFPTPPAVVERMLEEANLQPEHIVLEPSAGAGHIALAAKKIARRVYAMEINAQLCEVASRRGVAIMRADFLQERRSEADPAGYDRILMNPPFEHLADIDHVRHAFGFLNDGGRLVAIMGEGAFFRSDRKAQEFRQWLNERGGISEQLPAGSFACSDRPTGVSTRLVIIDN